MVTIDLINSEDKDNSITENLNKYQLYKDKIKAKKNNS